MRMKWGLKDARFICATQSVSAKCTTSMGNMVKSFTFHVSCAVMVNPHFGHYRVVTRCCRHCIPKTALVMAPARSSFTTKHGNNWRQLQHPHYPYQRIRRSSYPPQGGGTSLFDSNLKRKERTLTEYDFGVGITRRDTIKETQGCRRHTLVLGRSEDPERRPPL